MAASKSGKTKTNPQKTQPKLYPALGFLELSSISRGLFLTDTLVKKAPVKIISSQPISSGKHVVLYFGEVAEVEEAHQAALELAQSFLVKQVFIPGVHEKLVPFLDSIWTAKANLAPVQKSAGIVESSTLAGAILAADRALKMARVDLSRMRLGQGIGGKAYFVLSGEQSEVEAAVEAAKLCLQELESYCQSDIIPRPMSEATVHF